MANPLIGVARSISGQQESLRQQREQNADNSARLAFFLADVQVSGVGYQAIPTPVEFDTVFIEKPAIAGSPELIVAPDMAHYRYPLVNVGVHQWITQPTPAAMSSKGGTTTDTLRASGGTLGASGVVAFNELGSGANYSDDEVVYTGAYVYVVVYADPLQRPRTDGSNLADLQALVPTTTDPDQLTALNLLIAEAKEAVYLKAHPAKVTVNVSMIFLGEALKTVPDAVHSALDSDPDVAPVVPTGAGGQDNSSSSTTDNTSDDA